MSEPIAKASLIQLSTEIVSSFIARNKIPPDQLPKLIQQVYHTLAMVSVGQPQPEPEEALKPFVPIRKSVHPDYLVCLQDGERMKMLKRHLQTVHGLTPEEYRAKWGLPSDYPMVAPNYAESRSKVAKEIGLRRRDKAE